MVHRFEVDREIGSDAMGTGHLAAVGLIVLAYSLVRARPKFKPAFFAGLAAVPVLLGAGGFLIDRIL